jgi:LemA protein
MGNSWWGLVCLALLVFWGLGAYNRLVRLRAAIGQKLAVVDNHLTRYEELVELAVTAAASAPFGWQSSIAPELGAAHWTRLQTAARKTAIAMAHWQDLLFSSAAARALRESKGELAQAWASLNHPDVYYITVASELQSRWAELDVLIQPDVERYNEAVIHYNAAIAQFPALLLARLFSFHPASPL